MTAEQPKRADSTGRRFRINLVSVLTVEVVTLLLLWLLQRTYTP